MPFGLATDAAVPATCQTGRGYTGVSGRPWVERSHDPVQAGTIARQHQLPETLARALAMRQIGVDQVEAFLNPRLREGLPDPLVLKDMDRAIDRVRQSVLAGHRIALFGDFDVDGATSSAVLGRYLRQIGCDVVVYIPDRLSEGYGPNIPAFQKLVAEGAQLIITLDCGISAHDPVNAARALGCDIVILDHHMPSETLPDAVAIVNPKRADDVSGLGMLAAAGLTFLFVVGLNRSLRQDGFFADRAEPDLLALLDLVALGTICDVVPLIGVNRVMAAQGLRRMAQSAQPGLAALASVAGIDSPLTAYHAGFLLGPRVNAAGRLGRSDLGSQLLMTDDATVALDIASRLDLLNKERQSVEAIIIEQAIAQAQSVTDDLPLLVVQGTGWHPGVLGIIAGRLRERFAKPVFVLGVDGAIAKGSGRSITGIDLGAVVLAARAEGILINGGGHPMAAGITISPERVAEFKSFASSHIMAQTGGHFTPEQYDIDAFLSVGAVHLDLARAMARLGPFGAGNPEPRFAILGGRVVQVDVLAKNNVRVRLADRFGASGFIQAIAFRCADDVLGQTLLAHQGQELALAGYLRIDTWNGRERVQMVIEDAAPA